MSADQHRRDLARLRNEQARVEQQRAAAETAAAKARADAAAKTAKAAKATGSSARSHARAAEVADKKAAAESAKAAAASKKLAANATKQIRAQSRLASALRTDQRKEDLETSRRRAAEKAHARAVARAASPTVVREIRYVPPPRPEPLRVLYLTADPDGDLRLGVEVRQVRQAVNAAVHRDLVQIDHRTAATPEDLLDGVSDTRPHVVHFAGHGRHRGVLFDDAVIRDEPDEHQDYNQDEDGRGRPVDFLLLGRALGATDAPLSLLVLNACDTLDGAEDLLDAVPIVIAMSADVSDLAATVFAARFYRAVASGEPVQHAFDQGKVAVELAGLDEGEIPVLLARPDVDPSGVVLVTAPGTDPGE